MKKISASWGCLLFCLCVLNRGLGAQPGPLPSATGTLAGAGRSEYESLLSLVGDAAQAADVDAQRSLLKEFLDKSEPFSRSHPDLRGLQLVRATVMGLAAGRHLQELSGKNGADPEMQKVLGELEQRGWVTKEGAYRGPVSGKEWTVARIFLPMVWIVPGTFTMGSPESEAGRGYDEAQHEVTLTKGYWLGKYAVTTMQWLVVMGYNPSRDNNETGDAPVESVSWNEAMAFCHKLTAEARKEGTIPYGYEYTLPTEAQWEYACRAGTTEAFGGDGKLDDMGWYAGNSDDHKHPVGEKRPNAWGLYDMNGNVFQWCRDWYTQYPRQKLTDPIGGEFGSERVFRGGSYRNFAAYARSAYRYGHQVSDRGATIGLRLALAPQVDP